MDCFLVRHRMEVLIIYHSAYWAIVTEIEIQFICPHHILFLYFITSDDHINPILNRYRAIPVSCIKMCCIEALWLRPEWTKRSYRYVRKLGFKPEDICILRTQKTQEDRMFSVHSLANQASVDIQLHANYFSLLFHPILLVHFFKKQRNGEKNYFIKISSTDGGWGK